MACSGEEEVVHLSLESVVNLDVNVIAGGLLSLSLPQLLDSDHVVDHNRVRWMQQWVQPLRDLRKFHSLRLDDICFYLDFHDEGAKNVFDTHRKNTFNDIDHLEDLLQEGVAVDEFLLVLILQLVGLDVLPQRRNDHRPVGCQVSCVLDSI